VRAGLPQIFYQFLLKQEAPLELQSIKTALDTAAAAAAATANPKDPATAPQAPGTN
jgi:hypothetical protein